MSETKSNNSNLESISGRKIGKTMRVKDKLTSENHKKYPAYIEYDLANANHQRKKMVGEKEKDKPQFSATSTGRISSGWKKKAQIFIRKHTLNRKSSKSASKAKKSEEIPNQKPKKSVRILGDEIETVSNASKDKKIAKITSIKEMSKKLGNHLNLNSFKKMIKKSRKKSVWKKKKSIENSKRESSSNVFWMAMRDFKKDINSKKESIVPQSESKSFYREHSNPVIHYNKTAKKRHSKAETGDYSAKKEYRNLSDSNERKSNTLDKSKSKKRTCMKKNQIAYKKNLSTRNFWITSPLLPAPAEDFQERILGIGNRINFDKMTKKNRYLKHDYGIQKKSAQKKSSLKLQTSNENKKASKTLPLDKKLPTKKQSKDTTKHQIDKNDRTEENHFASQYHNQPSAEKRAAVNSKKAVIHMNKKKSKRKITGNTQNPATNAHGICIGSIVDDKEINARYCQTARALDSIKSKKSKADIAKIDSDDINKKLQKLEHFKKPEGRFAKFFINEPKFKNLKSIQSNLNNQKIKKKKENSIDKKPKPKQVVYKSYLLENEGRQNTNSKATKNNSKDLKKTKKSKRKVISETVMKMQRKWTSNTNRLDQQQLKVSEDKEIDQSKNRRSSAEDYPDIEPVRIKSIPSETPLPIKYNQASRRIGNEWNT